MKRESFIYAAIIILIIAVFYIMQKSRFTLKRINPAYYHIIDNFIDTVLKASREFNVPPEIIFGIIKQESNGYAGAIGQAGELGLMQIMPAALIDSNIVSGRNYTFQEMTNPEKNIIAGTGYFRWCLNRVNTLPKEILKQTPKNVTHKKIWHALRMYNAGIGNASRRITAGAVYADSVFNHINQFRNEGIETNLNNV